jgi:predicted esterase
VTITRQTAFIKAFDPKHGRLETLYLDVYSAGSGLDTTVDGLSSVSLANHTRKATLPRRPAVVLVHGGAFLIGSKDHTVLQDEAVEVARHGFVAFVINYREDGRYGVPSSGAVRDAVTDTHAAVRFAVLHADSYGVDPHRIAVWGSSAGAITGASMNFIEDSGDPLNAQNLPSNISAAVGISGCVWPFFATRDPKRSLVPWFNVHGDHDTIVPPFLPAATRLYLDAHGASPAANVLAVVPKGGHVPWSNCFTPGCKKAPRDILRPHIMSFLVTSMRLEGHGCPGR